MDGRVRTLITSNRSPSKKICFTGFLPWSLARFSQSRTSIQRTSPSEFADHQQHGERLRHPVFRGTLLLEREDFHAVASALARVGIARLELQAELRARGLVRVVIELNLHVDALIAHIELPADLVRERHGGTERSEMDRSEATCPKGATGREHQMTSPTSARSLLWLINSMADSSCMSRTRC